MEKIEKHKTKEQLVEEFEMETKKRSAISDVERIDTLTKRESLLGVISKGRQTYLQHLVEVAPERDKGMITSQDILELYKLEKTVKIDGRFVLSRQFENTLNRVIVGLIWAIDNPGATDLGSSEIDAAEEFIENIREAEETDDKIIAVDQFLNYVHTPGVLLASKLIRDFSDFDIEPDESEKDPIERSLSPMLQANFRAGRFFDNLRSLY